MSQFTIGLDIGGTNIKAGLVNRAGRVCYATNLPTKSFARNKAKLIGAIISCIRETITRNRLAKRNISGIGIGLPGFINSKEGIVYQLVNIFGWKNTPLKRILERETHIPTFIDNDVNVITLGEWRYGAGRGFEHMLCITLGTGVGGGLIINNELYRGPGYVAGEIGHIPLNESGLRCNCGGYGCLETHIGNQHLLSKARKIFDKKQITLEDVSRLASRGNQQAVKFWEGAARQLGIALSGVVNILNPQCIVIGGGVANADKFLFKTIRETIRSRAVKISADLVKVVKAELGQNAGILGTHVLVKRERHIA